MDSEHVREWSPITDLTEALKKPRDRDILPLIQAWQERKHTLESQEVYVKFLDRLRRQWAIETGIIENLYTLNDGATRTLIQSGLDAALIGASDTDRSPQEVIQVIRNQHHAIEGLYQFVSNQQQLTTVYIRQLHQVLTANQEYCDAVDFLGNLTKAKLLKGTWKKWPNTIRFEDGTSFEYCPPEQVESEIERLIALHNQHQEEGVPPEVEAAWLHHRFVLIHPFQDGNGRIARCLATLVVLKAGWLPLVLTRQDRPDYIKALRQADGDDLSALVQLFAAKLRRSIRRALELSEEVSRVEPALADAIDSVAQVLKRRKQEIDDQEKSVFAVADALHDWVSSRLEELSRRLDSVVKISNSNFSCQSQSVSRFDSRSGYHRFQIGECASHFGYFANLEILRSWALLYINMDVHTEILFSFHGSGRHSDGVLACAGMLYKRIPVEETAELTTRRHTVATRVEHLEPLTKEPFEFSYTETHADVIRRFEVWYNDAIKNAIDLWKSQL